jgi:hypothetical protein
VGLQPTGLSGGEAGAALIGFLHFLGPITGGASMQAF